MRIALLSTLARTVDGTPRALLTLGGRPLIGWQMDLARNLGCERVLCLVDGGGEAPQVVHDEAQAVGLPLELIGGPRHLLGKVTADQDLVIIADGLIIDPDLARRNFLERRGVAALSDYPAVEEGFERIDPEHAWAGLVVARGSIAEQLADMPADADTISLLLRLALQSGTRIIRLDDRHIGSGEILLASTAEDLVQRETALLDHSRGKTSLVAPGEAVASLIARRLAPRALNRGPVTALSVGVAALSVAIFAAVYDLGIVALTTLVIAAFCIAISQALRHLRTRLHGQRRNRPLSMFLNGLVDLGAVTILTLGSTAVGLLSAAFAPLVVIGLWRLSAALSPASVAPFWRDRTVMGSILLLLGGFGVLNVALPLLSLGMLAFCLISEASARLTRV